LHSVTSNAVYAAINNITNATVILDDNDVNLQVRVIGKLALFSITAKRVVNKSVDISSYECLLFDINPSSNIYNNTKSVLTWSGQMMGEIAIVPNNGKRLEVNATGLSSGSLFALLK
jgi:hypothetical protein